MVMSWNEFGGLSDSMDFDREQDIVFTGFEVLKALKGGYFDEVIGFVVNNMMSQGIDKQHQEWYDIMVSMLKQNGSKQDVYKTD
jgi:hypothetical protein